MNNEQWTMNNYGLSGTCMREDNLVADKSKKFAIRIIRLYQHLMKEKQEFVLSKQVLRSGTSIGANVKEALEGQSKADFTAKMQIALKEASETEYWLELLTETEYIDEKAGKSILADCRELNKLIIAIVKTAKANQEKN